MTTNNAAQTDIFSLFGIEDEYAEKKKREEEERMRKQAELSKKMEENKKNTSSSKTDKAKDVFEVNSETIIYFYTETIDINEYFSTEELENGLPKKNNDGNIEYKKIQENDVKNRLKKEYPVISAGAELVYVKKQNMISIILKAKKKGNINCKEEESNLDSSSSSKQRKQIPFHVLRDFISVARHFSLNYGTEVHADIYWNVKTDSFFMDIPKQLVHPYWVEVTEEPEVTITKFEYRQCMKVMEVHSHHTMSPIPSPQDDESERAPILYAIIGNIDRFFPEITVRTFDIHNQKHIPLDAWDIFENPFTQLSSKTLLDGVEVCEVSK